MLYLRRGIKSRFPNGSIRFWPAAALISVLLAMLVVPAPLVSSNSLTTSQSPDEWPMQTVASMAVPASRDRNKVEPVELSSLNTKSGREAGLAVAQAGRGTRGTTDYGVVNVEFQNAAARVAFKQPGATVLTAFDRFADMFINSLEVLDAIAKRPEVVWVDWAGSASAPPPPSGETTPPTRQIPDRIVRGGISGLTGKGVIIAIVDTGIDFRHPDFITYDNQGQPTSRLLYMWDTTSNAFDAQKIGSKAPFSYPNGASIGTLYTRDQLNAELRSGTKRIPPADLNGHGTACASVAAGNGNGDRVTGGLNRPETIGVATEADLIAVKIDQGDDADGLENSYLLNAAVEWMDRVAGARPLVVSCSFGGHKGGHDGQLVAERHLDARFPMTKRGRAIVIAAGNEGSDTFHSRADFAGESQAKLVKWNTQSVASLTIYFDSNDGKDISYALAGKTRGELKSLWTNPFTNQLAARLSIEPGVGGIWLLNKSGKSMKANLYLFGRGEFAPDDVTFETLVGTPGTSSNAITVGSYDWNHIFHQKGALYSIGDVCGLGKELTVGALSCYSSPGYTRNGKVKPEFVAPGEWFTSSYAKNHDGTGVSQWRVDSTGNYVAMNGTSASTPYAAGIIALMLQKKPGLTYGEIRNLLTANVSRDAFTGSVPNPRWGHGKLDLTAVQKILGAF
ncbi:MAG TPA: S8 family serine peptidase [Pyrinomonadaceae bacterium]|nr:S8 family serine peptidase [Pyrinomonadaceae bacterium]